MRENTLRCGKNMDAAFVPEDFFRTHAAQDIFPQLAEGRGFEVDLGCGDGGFLIQMAAHYPERMFLGVERLLGRVRKVCRESYRNGLHNVRALRMESRYFLEYFVEQGSISRLHYLFPDPWPKEKHHKNRLVQESFVPVLHRALSDGGEILFKTDHEEYFVWVCDLLNQSPLFEQVEWDEPFYPKTDFQQQWEAQGKEIYSAKYLKRSLHQ